MFRYSPPSNFEEWQYGGASQTRTQALGPMLHAVDKMHVHLMGCDGMTLAKLSRAVAVTGEACTEDGWQASSTS